MGNKNALSYVAGGIFAFIAVVQLCMMLGNFFSFSVYFVVDMFLFSGYVLLSVGGFVKKQLFATIGLAILAFAEFMYFFAQIISIITNSFGYGFLNPGTYVGFFFDFVAASLFVVAAVLAILSKNKRKFATIFMILALAATWVQALVSSFAVDLEYLLYGGYYGYGFFGSSVIVSIMSAVYLSAAYVCLTFWLKANATDI